MFEYNLYISLNIYFSSWKKQGERLNVNRHGSKSEYNFLKGRGRSNSYENNEIKEIVFASMEKANNRSRGSVRRERFHYLIYNRINTRLARVKRRFDRIVLFPSGKDPPFPFHFFRAHFPDKIFQALSWQVEQIDEEKSRFLPVLWGLASLHPDTSRTTTINSFIRIFALKKKKEKENQCS